MRWTTPDQLKSQVQRLWDRGLILESMVKGGQVFPRKLVLKKPTSRELSDCFDDVRRWISLLAGAEGPYRIEWKTVDHRILGSNHIPWEIWVDTLEDGLGMIAKGQAGKRFYSLLDRTLDREPHLILWLEKRPLMALELFDQWNRLLDVTSWIKNHPRPSIYLRQIDISGVHSKFIEGHRSVLAEMFDLALPEDVIDRSATGLGGFCRRYGFRDKPLRVRFRILDPELALSCGGKDQDITVTQSAFAELDLGVSKVFVTENEVNFLAFPQVPRGMLIFGAGYGFENLASATWLKEKQVYYWGDLDTHGFAILNQFRSILPNAASFLMDRDTLLAHRPFWGEEPAQETANLPRLTNEEQDLYDQLRGDHWGKDVRLEQERISFRYIHDSLKKTHSVSGYN